MIVLVCLVVKLRNLVVEIWESMISWLETINYIVLLEIKWIIKSDQQLIQKI